MGAMAKWIRVATALMLTVSLARAEESVLGRLEQEIREIAQKAGPAVVRVSARREMNLMKVFPPGLSADQGRFPRFLTSSSTVGTGFLVGKDQVITTNLIATGAITADVEFPGGVLRKGKILGGDPFFQVAVIKIEPVSGVKPLVLAAETEVSAPCLGVFLGHPIGRDRNVSLGIITQTRQSTGFPGGYDNYFVVNAPIHPGDIGGPLLDSEGRVRGMGVGHAGQALKVFSRDGQRLRLRSFGSVPGMGFGIPASDLDYAISEIEEYGRVRTGRLGVLIRPESLEITHVRPESPAAKSGLESGDVFVSVGGRKLRGDSELRFVLRRTPVESLIRLEVRRGEEVLTVESSLAESTPEAGAILPGIRITTSRGAPQVLGVDERLSALGIKPGDVIVSIFGQKVESPLDLMRVLPMLRENPTPLKLVVRRGDEKIEITVPR